MYTWQQKQFTLLCNAYRQNRLSHAYLLSGAAGLGKTNLARDFAAYLLCQAATVSPCTLCRSCKQFQSKTHPDFIFIEPDEKSRSIKIDQIRALSEKLSQTSHSGGYQVVIISPADAMPVQAANALLKTLEEPGGRVILLLIDNQQHILPATIVSRCQQIYFSNDDTAVILKSQDVILRDAIQQHLQQIIERRSNPIAPIVSWVKNDLAMILEIITLFCVDISRAQYQVNPGLMIDKANATVCHALSKKISALKLQQFMMLLNEKKTFIAKGINLNAQLCLENVFIKWSGVS